jgi:tRNA threonylcarbamoyl adenosine modification protein YeaZ
MAEIPVRQPPGGGRVLPPAPGNGLVLALDAGSPLVSVAVGRGGGTLALRAVPQQRSSTQLLALVAEALAELGARPADLAGVVALAGPGSFTGLRAALATALGFHQGLGLPALAVPTLAAMAAASDAPAGSLVIAAVDALRGEWSAQAFRAGPVPEPLGEMELLAGGDLLRRWVPDGDERPRRLASSAAGGGAGQGASRGGAEGRTIPLIVAFGVAALRDRQPAGGPPARFGEAPPLAPAALRLAAAEPAAAWRAETLAAPIYSRPPAATAPKPRLAPAGAPSPRP